jgi:hypothetical protein
MWTRPVPLQAPQSESGRRAGSCFFTGFEASPEAARV